jgi:hypothetical protein
MGEAVEQAAEERVSAYGELPPPDAILGQQLALAHAAAA